MAWLDVLEFQYMGQVPASDAQVGHVGSIVAEQNVPISGSSQQSNAFNSLTRLVRLHTDATCRIEWSKNPTATVPNGGGVQSNSQRMVAGQTEYFSVPEGGSYKVAVISSS